jgi:outer membrane protein assembly factor BamB
MAAADKSPVIINPQFPISLFFTFFTETNTAAMKNRTESTTRSARNLLLPTYLTSGHLKTQLLRSALITALLHAGTPYRKIALLLILLVSAAACSGQKESSHHNWSQWMGENRKATWNPGIQKDTLTTSDLVKRWETPIGTGYSGPTVHNNRVYVMDYTGKGPKYERVLCFDATTGRELWSHQYERTYSVGYPTGPRASVLIAEGRAYSLGTMGDLYCLDAQTGEVLWYVDGEKEYNISFPTWGLSSSPLIENDLLIVQLGGTPSACLVAFDKATGEEAWRALPDEASYSSPIVIGQAGKRVLVCWTGDNLAGLDPGTGEVYWTIPYVHKKEVINIAMPVVEWHYIFLSSFYDGSMLIKLNADSPAASLVWKRAGESERMTDALHCVMSTPVIRDGYVYGLDSYGELRCLDLLTGDRIWTDSTLVPYGRWANAHFVTQNKKIWAFNEKGELVLGKLTPEGFSDLGRVELVKPVRVSPNPRGGVNWAHPAFAGRKIYARSDAKLVCWELVE